MLYDAVRQFWNQPNNPLFGSAKVASLEMVMYYYNETTELAHLWRFGYCAPLRNLLAMFYRSRTLDCIRRKHIGRGFTIPNAGWHLSYFMTAQEISDKLGAFSHAEYDTPKWRDIDRIQHHIDNKLDLFDRPQMMADKPKYPPPPRYWIAHT